MKISEPRFALYEHQNQSWVATAESGTTLEDVLRPEYFANVANRMRQYDKVFIRVDDGGWYAELLVVQCGKNWAQLVKVIAFEFEESINESEAREEVFSAYFVKHNGPHKKWCVIRKSDKEEIKEGCNTRGEAQAWLSSYIMTL